MNSVNRSFTHAALALILAATLASSSLNAAIAQPPMWKRAANWSWNTTKNVAGGAITLGKRYVNFLKSDVKASAQKVHAGMLKTQNMSRAAKDKFIEKCADPNFRWAAAIAAAGLIAGSGAGVGYGLNSLMPLVPNYTAAMVGSCAALFVPEYLAIDNPGDQYWYRMRCVMWLLATASHRYSFLTDGPKELEKKVHFIMDLVLPPAEMVLIMRKNLQHYLYDNLPHLHSSFVLLFALRKISRTFENKLFAAWSDNKTSITINQLSIENKVFENLGKFKDQDCGICLASFNLADAKQSALYDPQVFQLPCNHIFHESCLRQWIRTEQGAKQPALADNPLPIKPTCPFCKATYEIKDIKRIRISADHKAAVLPYDAAADAQRDARQDEQEPEGSDADTDEESGNESDNE